jgi:hypothetical protein
MWFFCMRRGLLEMSEFGKDFSGPSLEAGGISGRLEICNGKRSYSGS